MQKMYLRSDQMGNVIRDMKTIKKKSQIKMSEKKFTGWA